MAAFQVFMYGRFWVFTEALSCIQRFVLAERMFQHKSDSPGIFRTSSPYSDR
jgi:hypothetical protein